MIDRVEYSMKSDVDFLGNKFETYKCSRCRKEHRRMASCSSSYTCPKCTNKAEEESEES